LVRKECFERAGFYDENIRISVDTDIIIRIAKHYKFNYLNKIYTNRYIGNDCTSHNKKLFLITRIKLFKKYFNETKKFNRKANVTKLIKLNWFCYRLRKPRFGKIFLYKAIRISPFDIRPYIILLNTKIDKNYWGRKFLARRIYKKGFYLCLEGKMREGRRLLRRSRKVFPFFIKSYFVYPFTFNKTIFKLLFKSP